ncbi:MAG: bile acid:sodium symporter family protein [Cyanobium sp.]
MQILITATLLTLMFGLGLGLQVGVVNRLRQRPLLCLRVLIGTCVLVPLVALLLLSSSAAAHLSRPVKLAIALMAICPSAPLTLRKATKQGGDHDLAALLQLLAAAAAIVSVPLLADLYREVFRISGWDVHPSEVVRQVLLAQGLPLGLGMLVRHRWPELAERLAAPIDRFAMLLLITVAVLVISAPQLARFLADNAAALPVMALMVLVALTIGWFLSGPGMEERTTIALVTSMRNPGLALLLATIHASGLPGIKFSILTYLLLTIVLTIPFLRLRRRLILATEGSAAAQAATGGGA